MTDVTRLLCAMSAGDSGAADRLFTLVYSELTRLAQREAAGELPGRTLCASDLVHEAYLRLIGPDGRLSFENRRHLYGAAARAMRRILIESARRRGRIKRGGGMARVEFREVAADEPDAQLVALEAALSELGTCDKIAAEIVELHHFAGLSYDKTAELLGVSTYEVRRKWAFARAWLSDQLK